MRREERTSAGMSLQYMFGLILGLLLCVRPALRNDVGTIPSFIHFLVRVRRDSLTEK